ncbi:MAG: DUF21 domain-containing protein [Proteobacteria bacterium]|nr:DUF21 domain-containing protein [Pseudomonadota bacterium]
MEDTTFYFMIGTIAVLILFSAFFSGAETSIMASSKPKLHDLQKRGDKRAKRVYRMLKDPETLLGTILLGNNLVNIGASALATSVFLRMFGEKGIAIATLVMTVVVLIFAEVLPKTIASHYPEKLAGMVSFPMSTLIRVLRPFTWTIKLITRAIMRMMRISVDRSDPNFGEEDLRGAIGMGLAHGILDRPEHRMLDSILELDELTVEDVMIHRSSIESIDINLPNTELYRRISMSTYSRIPLWEENPDNIVGTVHIKDFYKAWSTCTPEEFNIRTIMQDPYFVPETAIVSEQLLAFRKRRKHLGLVVDEYGDIMGLVTLEDILEEIVGDIEDEHDVVRAAFVREDAHTVVVTGSMAVRDANREFDWHLQDDDAVTVAGLIIETLQRIPVVGEKVTIGDYELEILAKRKQAIARVRVRTAGHTEQKKDDGYDEAITV